MGHDNKHLGGDSGDSGDPGSTITTSLPPPPFANGQHQHLSPQPHPPLASPSTLPPQSQFSSASSESALFHVGNDDPEQFQLGFDQGGLGELWEGGDGEGANISEIFLQGLGEDSTFQGLDATVSGGYLFGWPDGPVY